jgi:hypothetical protein
MLCTVVTSGQVTVTSRVTVVVLPQLSVTVNVMV